MNRKMTKPLSGFQLSALAISVASALSVSSAFAEDVKELPQVKISEEAINAESYKVDYMSSSKYSQPLAETTKTITVISEEVMKDRGVTSLRDSLRGVSGISMAAGEGGTPTGDSITIRGFSARTDVFVDGIRDIAGYSRDIYNTEAVEVTKGPGSSVTGRGSVGGAINLSRKAARLDTFTTLGAVAGDQSNHRITLDTNQILGDTTAIRLNGLTTDGDVAGRDGIENGMDALALSLATGLGTDTRFTFSAEHQNQDRIPDYGMPWVPNYSDRTDRDIADNLKPYEGSPPPVSFDNFYGNVNRDFEDIKATTFNGLFERDLSADSMISLQARYGTVERKSIVTAPRFVTRTVDGVNIYGLDGVRLNAEKTRDQENTMLALQAAYIATVGNHDFSIGTEYYVEEEERWTLSDNGTDNLIDQTNDFYNPDPNKAYTGSYSRTGAKATAESKTLALYAFDTITLNDKWAVNGGLRLERYESDTKTSDGVQLARSDTMLSWNAGALYRLADNGNVYFSVGKSFNPAAEDLTASTRGNEIDLAPEESYGFELGTKWELFDKRLLASAALFRTEKTNARSDDPVDNGRNEVLEGEQRVQGIELSAFGQITDQLSLTASYTYQDSEVIKATGEDAASQQGNQLARTPENSFNLWANYKPTAKLSMGVGYEYVDERYNSTSSGGRETAPDYSVVDAMVSYQVSKDLLVQLNGNNITDERYVDLAGGGHFVPGVGRSYNLSAYYSF
jgi:catecholate siderophore receptor